MQWTAKRKYVTLISLRRNETSLQKGNITRRLCQYCKGGNGADPCRNIRNSKYLTYDKKINIPLFMFVRSKHPNFTVVYDSIHS
jgi:hypothetical protein